jgi:hypothetical protein
MIFNLKVLISTFFIILIVFTAKPDTWSNYNKHSTKNDYVVYYHGPDSSDNTIIWFKVEVYNAGWVALGFGTAMSNLDVVTFYDKDDDGGVPDH